jgi:hypothetical protein
MLVGDPGLDFVAMFVASSTRAGDSGSITTVDGATIAAPTIRAGPRPAGNQGTASAVRILRMNQAEPRRPNGRADESTTGRGR